jgi:hypothetical protein
MLFSDIIFWASEAIRSGDIRIGCRVIQSFTSMISFLVIMGGIALGQEVGWRLLAQRFVMFPLVYGRKSGDHRQFPAKAVILPHISCLHPAVIGVWGNGYGSDSR